MWSRAEKEIAETFLQKVEMSRLEAIATRLEAIASRWEANSFYFRDILLTARRWHIAVT